MNFQSIQSSVTTILTLATPIALVVIGYLFSRKLEALRQQNASEVEELKSRLQQTQLREQIVFSSFHSKRAEIVEAMFNKIVLTHESFIQLLINLRASHDILADRISKAEELSQDLQSYIVDKTLYFDSKQVEELDNITHRMRNALYFARELLGDSDDPEFFAQTCRDLVHGLSEIRLSITADFRRLVGVPDRHHP